jgi:hypothetical protein
VKTSGLLYAAIVFLPVTALAGGPFDGTWKVNMNHIHLSKKPSVYVIAGGNYTCSSCGPAYTVKADGTDQKVSGHDYDTVTVTLTPTTLTVSTKLKGKALSNVKTTLSADGSTREEFGTYTTGAQPVLVRSTAKRVGPAAPGDNPFAGSWLDTKIESVSDSGAIETLAMTDDGFTMSGNGESYDAKFDGKQYPVTGDPTNGTVMLKKISASQVVESDYSHGKLVETEQMTVSTDGKTLQIVDSQLRTGRVTRYTLDKQ